MHTGFPKVAKKIIPWVLTAIIDLLFLRYLYAQIIFEMSVIVIKVKNERNISILRKLIGVFSEKASVFSDEEYRDKIASALIEDGLKTEIVPEDQNRKEFRKRGIAFWKFFLS